MSNRKVAFTRWPQTDDELWHFVAAIWKVKIPRKAVCPGHDAPFTAFADADFARHDPTIWLGSRGFAGKSFTLATLALTEATCLAAPSTVLGGSGAQSQNVSRYLDHFWNLPYAPRELLATAPTKTRTELTNGASIEALMASSTQVRGPHPVRLRCVWGGSEIVLTGGTTLPLRQLRRGQKLLSFDAAERTVVEDVVRDVWCSGQKQTLDVIFENGELLRLTDIHEVLTTNRGWQHAKSLLIGESCIGIHDSVKILSISKGPIVDVWDVGVAVHHNFIADGIVVHNCDEVDEMQPFILEAALGQPMSKNGVKAQTVLSSTHHYPNGPMTDMLRRAANLGWRVYRWCLAPDTLVATPSGEKRLDSICAGEEVYGWNGRSIARGKVSWAGFTRTSDTLYISLANGRRLQCTPDHQILTQRGWIDAKDSIVGDRFVSAVWGADSFSSHWPKNKIRPLSPMLVETSTAHDKKMRGLSGGNLQTVDSLSLLPIQEFGDRKQDARAREGSIAREEMVCGEGQSFYLKDGTTGGRVVYDVWSEVQTPRVFRDIRRRFRSAKRKTGGGSVQRVLPSLTVIEGSRSTSSERSEESRLSIGRTVGRQTAPVVEGTSAYVAIIAIEAGPVIDTWDLTVPGLDSFVAEGVVVHNCYKETMPSKQNPYGWLSPEDVEAKRKLVTAAMWTSEYDLNEPTFEGRAIQTDKVDLMFDPELGEFEGADGELIEIEPPFPGARYATGADWGRKIDDTVITTYRINETPWKMVAFQRLSRRPWPVMFKAFNDRCAKYPGYRGHDETGLGDVARSYINPDSDGSNDLLVGEILQGGNRDALMSEYIAAIENEQLRAPRIKSVWESHRYLSVEELWASNGAHTPDDVCSGAIAYRAHRQARSKAVVKVVRRLPPHLQRQEERIRRLANPW